MNDKELLELAAKAAGIELTWWQELPRITTGFDPAHNIYSAPVWAPLTDDGDALRLAVKLGLQMSLNGDQSDVTDSDARFVCVELKWADPYAATRRAIVRAAAEIGARK